MEEVIQQAAPQAPRGLVDRMLDTIERVGNRLPDPVTLFIGLTLIVFVGSYFAAEAGLSALKPGSGETIVPVSLMSADAIRAWIVDAPRHFALFPPLATVLVAMLGVGVAERSGLLAALLGRLVACSPRVLLTPIIVFIGVLSNVAADVGYVVVVPLSAMLFAASGRHPIAGLAAAFAGVSGGFSANILLSTLDPMLAGISEAAAHIVDPAYTVSAVANYTFMAASTVTVALLAWYVTDRVIEPRLPAWRDQGGEEMQRCSASEARGMRFAGIAFAVLLGLILWATLPEGALLRNPATGGFVPSPLIGGVVILIMLVFLIPGIAYGVGTRTYKSDRDVARAMSQSMSDMGYYLVLAFFAAQFIALFADSKLGLILAINGAEALQALGLSGLPLLLLFVLLTGFINLFIGSASAKWALLAPIFVPMLMLTGFSPEATQLAYRIGDSVTNIITPLMVYFPMVLVMAKRYLPNYGLGNLIALMLPYSVVFLIGWSVMLAAWLALGLPIGPGVSTFLPVAG